MAGAEVHATTRKRRPWLGIVCAVALVAIAVGVWWHVEDPFYPYRDGTTHAAQLVNLAPSDCLPAWGVTMGTHAGWDAQGSVPDSWLPGPVDGTVHIVHQQSTYPVNGQSTPSAYFEARGRKIPLVGGTGLHFSLAPCAIR
jgi:hypothetical protein